MEIELFDFYIYRGYEKKIYPGQDVWIISIGIKDCNLLLMYLMNICLQLEWHFLYESQ